MSYSLRPWPKKKSRGVKCLTDHNGMLLQTFFMDHQGHLYEWMSDPEFAGTGEPTGLGSWRWVPKPTAAQLAQFEAMQTELDQEADTLWSRFVNSRLMRPLFLRLEWLLDRFFQRKLYADAPELDDDDWNDDDDEEYGYYIGGTEKRH